MHHIIRYARPIRYVYTSTKYSCNMTCMACIIFYTWPIPYNMLYMTYTIHTYAINGLYVYTICYARPIYTIHICYHMHDTYFYNTVCYINTHAPQAKAPLTIFPALDDDSVDVRGNVYEALASSSITGPGEKRGGRGKQWTENRAKRTKASIVYMTPWTKMLRPFSSYNLYSNGPYISVRSGRNYTDKAAAGWWDAVCNKKTKRRYAGPIDDTAYSEYHSG